VVRLAGLGCTLDFGGPARHRGSRYGSHPHSLPVARFRAGNQLREPGRSEPITRAARLSLSSEIGRRGDGSGRMAERLFLPAALGCAFDEGQKHFHKSRDH